MLQCTQTPDVAGSEKRKKSVASLVTEEENTFLKGLYCGRQRRFYRFNEAYRRCRESKQNTAACRKKRADTGAFHIEYPLGQRMAVLHAADTLYAGVHDGYAAGYS
jgi:hypothetical protein